MQGTPLRKKSVVLDGHEFILHGRHDDAYFNNTLGDNHEPEFLALCRKLVTEDAVCLDIGANIGIKTLTLARHARSGRAVEAGHRNAECLSVNVEANKLNNVDVVNAAISGRRNADAHNLQRPLLDSPVPQSHRRSLRHRSRNHKPR